VNVEIVLTDFIPRKVMAPMALLLQFPAVLRAFIKYCHEQRGIDPALTRETMAAVDRYEPKFRSAIDGSGGKPEARRRTPYDDFDDDDNLSDEDLIFEVVTMVIADMIDAVGGPEALDSLDDEPLADEAFSWDEVPPGIRARVGEVLEWTDRCCDEMLNLEYRTACRRYLARVAARDPNIFRRQGKSNTAAAAVCWTISKANDLFGVENGILVKDLLEFFNISSGGISQRADTMMRALEVVRDEYNDLILLGMPDLLVSKRRRQIMMVRDKIASGEPLFE
jgi:hypothetical protein